MTIPKQNQWPAKYFLYGALVEQEGKLMDVLGLEGTPAMRDAVVCGGEVRMWGEKKAMVDAARGDMVRGKMFVVQSKEEEDKLRDYQGEGYEVCRCKIELGGGEQYCALTFRFVGDEGSLSRGAGGGRECV